jgi:two-component system NarL family sensor kinase
MYPGKVITFMETIAGLLPFYRLPDYPMPIFSKRPLLFFFILLAIVRLPGQPPIDSLKSALENTKSPAAKLDILEQLTFKYAARGSDSTLLYGQQMTEIAIAQKNYRQEARAYVTLGFWHHNKGQYERAKELYFKAKKLADQYDLSSVQPSLYAYLGMTYQRVVQPDSALLYFLKAEQAFIDAETPYELWTVYNGLFNLSAERGDTAQARVYAEKAWEIVGAGTARIDRGYLLFRLMSHFFQIGDFGQMARYQSLWQEYQLEKKTSVELMQTPAHVSMFSFAQEGDTSIATQYKKSLAFFENEKNLYRAAWSAEDLGMYYLDQGDLNNARTYLERSLDLYQQCQAGYRRGRVLFQLYKLAKQEEQSAQALNYLERYRVLADSLSGVEVQKNLNELKVQYETEKKEQELRIQSMEILQKTQQRNALLGSSFVLALLALGIFLGLRQRIQINRRLATQESELQQQRIQQLEQEKRLGNLKAMIQGQEKERQRIANDLHDSLGGLLTAARNQFDRSGQDDATLTILEEAGTELRRISQNLMPRALTLLGLQGALEDLATQLQQEGISCQLQFFNWSDTLSETQSIMLYRIVQELVHNVRKHAQATEVLIQCIQHEDELLVTVEDNGKGFDLEKARQKRSLGMGSIESRARYLQATLDIDTAPGEGTTINLSIPVPKSI